MITMTLKVNKKRLRNCVYKSYTIVIFILLQKNISAEKTAQERSLSFAAVLFRRRVFKKYDTMHITIFLVKNYGNEDSK